MKRERFATIVPTIVVGILAVLLAIGPLAGCGTQAAQAPQATESASATGGSSDAAESPAAAGASTGSGYAGAWERRDGYTLRQVVAVSRHNLRAPQQKDMDELSKSTTHDWISWSSNGSELTVKGGVAETIMGEFFRKWLEDEGLIPQNYIPGDGEVRFYANPRQRTLATTQFFSSGMLPVANVDIEYHGDYDTRDPTFKPRFGYVSDGYVDAATEQIAALGGEAGVAGLDAGLQPSYDLIQEVLDYQGSPAFRDGETTALREGEVGYGIELDEEPEIKGSFKTANKLSDALTLQYYEADTLADASFGTELTPEQWRQIAAVKNAYGDLRFGSRLVGVDCARLLASEVAGELGRDGRHFTFLCGHDSNQSSLLHALGVRDYELPDTIETKTPIGGKILFEVWENAAGERLCNVRYVYATTEQVRNLDLLSLQDPPASYDLEFEGIERNSDGLYSLADVQKALADVQVAYDRLARDYPQREQDEKDQKEGQDGQANEEGQVELDQAA